MSLDYTTLQSTVLADAVHAELTTEVVGFIRRAEALIRRKVHALELRTTLVEADRDTDGIYNLSGQVQSVRAIWAEGPSGDQYALENVGVAGIRQLAANAPVLHYAISAQQVEFRGVPGTDAELELIYRGWPDPLATTSTNELLTNHEDLYVCGTLHYLYRYTQDLELAQAELSAFLDAAEDLNKNTAKLTGGGSVQPAYNFGHVRIGRGY